MNVVFVFNEYALHNHIIESYCAARPADTISIVKVPLVLKGKGRTSTATRILPKLSKRFIWSKFKESVVLATIAFLPKVMGRGAIFRRLSSIARRHRAAFHQSQDVMSSETLKFIAQQKPDVVVTLFHQIIKKDLIAIPALGVVNLHPGILPEFRGIQPYFWELMRGFGKGGVTLHLIDDETIDTGRVLAKAQFATWAGMSVQLNYYLTSRCAAQILPQTLGLLAAGALAPRAQDPQAGAYYRWPDSQAVDQLQARGHPIVSWRDLAAMLIGRYDEFAATEIKYFEKK